MTVNLVGALAITYLLCFLDAWLSSQDPETLNPKLRGARGRNSKGPWNKDPRVETPSLEEGGKLYQPLSPKVKGRARQFRCFGLEFRIWG